MVIQPYPAVKWEEKIHIQMSLFESFNLKIFQLRIPVAELMYSGEPIRGFCLNFCQLYHVDNTTPELQSEGIDLQMFLKQAE